jgi:hypothetical protein
MQLVDIERKLLRWGHGYGIRLTADEVRRLGLAEGETVHASVQEARPRNQVAAAALFRFAGPYDIKAILEDAATDRPRAAGP